MTALLSLRGITKEYAATPPVRALRGVDLEVDRGAAVAVVGPSGSGKSTLLHIMGTLDRPTAGSVSIAGHDTGELPDRRLAALRARHIGFVFQSFYLLGTATALDNVADGLLYTGTSRRLRRQAALQALTRVGLAERVDHPASKLSGGEQQRVAIARAVVGEPDLLLADEPTGNLDTSTGGSVVDLLEDLNRDGMTVAVITHELDIAARFPHTVHLRDGQITP